MILHLGGDAVIRMKDVIAIIDIDTIENSQINKEFLRIAKEEDFVKRISKDEPKSIILAEVNKKAAVFMSPISSITLLKRSGFIDSISRDNNLNVSKDTKTDRD